MFEIKSYFKEKIYLYGCYANHIFSYQKELDYSPEIIKEIIEPKHSILAHNSNYKYLILLYSFNNVDFGIMNFHHVKNTVQKINLTGMSNNIYFIKNDEDYMVQDLDILNDNVNEYISRTEKDNHIKFTHSLYFDNSAFRKLRAKENYYTLNDYSGKPKYITAPKEFPELVLYGGFKILTSPWFYYFIILIIFFAFLFFISKYPLKF